MIKKLKSNKIIILLLVMVCVIFILNPVVYAKSSLNAISVWAFKLLPNLFPFFILTRLIVNLSSPKQNFMDKFFYKMYHTKNAAGVHFLSVISGYPMGAKLICDMYDMNRIDKAEAQKMLSFCSVSGPMFMIGSVGVSILGSYKAGVVILIANIIASLINGFIYRGKKTNDNNLKYETKEKRGDLLYDSVYSSMQAILMVGGFIVLSFLIIDVLVNLNVLNLLTNAICSIFNCKTNYPVVFSTLKGLIEMTRGIIDLSGLNIALSLKTIISSGLIAFGGVSIFMQSISFLTNLKIGFKTMFVQKLTQALLCIIITIPLALIFI